MSIKKRIYLSFFGKIISIIQHLIAFTHRPFMVYGAYNSVQKQWMKMTRIGSSSKILNKELFDIDDGVWVGHYCILDASNGLKIGKSVQTGSHVSIYTHSSHISIRLLGDKYLETDERVGYLKGAVTIEDYAFIGDSVVIFPGVTIGKGAVIKAGSVVTRSIPNFAIAGGVPARVTGNVFDLDRPFLEELPLLKDDYFDYGAYCEYMGKQDLLNEK